MLKSKSHESTGYELREEFNGVIASLRERTAARHESVANRLAELEEEDRVLHSLHDDLA